MSYSVQVSKINAISMKVCGSENIVLSRNDQSITNLNDLWRFLHYLKEVLIIYNITSIFKSIEEPNEPLICCCRNLYRSPIASELVIELVDAFARTGGGRGGQWGKRSRALASLEARDGVHVALLGVVAHIERHDLSNVHCRLVRAYVDPRRRHWGQRRTRAQSLDVAATGGRGVCVGRHAGGVGGAAGLHWDGVGCGVHWHHRGRDHQRTLRLRERVQCVSAKHRLGLFLQLLIDCKGGVRRSPTQVLNRVTCGQYAEK